MDNVLLNSDGKGLNYFASNEKNLGLLHVVTGDGKGKTTSGVGLCARASGAGYKVLFVQFFKMSTSELASLEKLDVDVEQFQALGSFFKKYSGEEFKELKKSFTKEWNKLVPRFKDYDLVVLDEIVYAVTDNILSEESFLQFLKERPKNTELVLTGRDFPESIKKRADYVSEVRRVKHPFYKGVGARKGVEF